MKQSEAITGCRSVTEQTCAVYGFQTVVTVDIKESIRAKYSLQTYELQNGVDLSPNIKDSIL